MPDLDNLEPLHQQGLADYHCHCDYSIDAHGAIDEYCRAALSRGLVEVVFTTHYDATPTMTPDDAVIRVSERLVPATPENLKPYVDEVLAAAERYYPLGLSVKLGLEFGWYRGCDDVVGRLRNMYPFEYLLCGIHELDGKCFSCSGCYPKCFPDYTVEQVVERYVTQVEKAARSGLFHTIAHLDYLRKYGEPYYGERLNQLILEQSGRMFAALRESGTVLEVNTSALRRNSTDYYPRIVLVNAARKAGVDVRYLGSDAHAPEQVGFDFDTAAPLASISTQAWCEDTD